LEETGASPPRVTIEITEDAMMADPALARSILGRLRNLGARVSIDDFGTGHSSLSYWKDYPVDEVKIDRSFVRGVADDRKSATIVRAICDLGRRLDFVVVAEGIEDAATLASVASLGCDFGQGYFLVGPRPVSDLEEWLDTRCVPDADAAIPA
jgi:EAL domain-containing protein (putative c-di-GMP-specific phosphodiesterase class I)